MEEAVARLAEIDVGIQAVFRTLLGVQGLLRFVLRLAEFFHEFVAHGLALFAAQESHHGGVGVAVAVAETAVVHDIQRHHVQLAAGVVQAPLDGRLVEVEGIEPMGGVLEEFKALQVREVDVVDVHVVLPHEVHILCVVHHLAEQLLACLLVQLAHLDVDSVAMLLAVGVVAGVGPQAGLQVSHHLLDDGHDVVHALACAVGHGLTDEGVQDVRCGILCQRAVEQLPQGIVQFLRVSDEDRVVLDDEYQRHVGACNQVRGFAFHRLSLGLVVHE